MKRILLVLLLLAACGDDGSSRAKPLVNGIAVVLSYDDPDTWTTDGMCISYDSGGGCDFRLPDEKHHDSAHWWVKVYDTDNDRLVDTEVAQHVYDYCRPGARWKESRCVG